MIIHHIKVYFMKPFENLGLLFLLTTEGELKFNVIRSQSSGSFSSEARVLVAVGNSLDCVKPTKTINSLVVVMYKKVYDNKVEIELIRKLSQGDFRHNLVLPFKLVALVAW